MAESSPLRRSARPRPPVSYIEEEDICTPKRKKAKSTPYTPYDVDAVLQARPTQSTLAHNDSKVARLKTICATVNVDFHFFDHWPDDGTDTRSHPSNVPYLPDEIILTIFSYCRSEVLLQCQKSCKRFESILKHEVKIWRNARELYYPGLYVVGSENTLPYGLDEATMFQLAYSKACDFCGRNQKSKAYFAWNVRCCGACIQDRTMTWTDFHQMLKKKTENQEGWCSRRRDQFLHAIVWHRNPNFSKICWKEDAFRMLQQAEEEILNDEFDEWICSMVMNDDCRIKELDTWATEVQRQSLEDKRLQISAIKANRKAEIHRWCMRLPNPIPPHTLTHLRGYRRLLELNSPLTKAQFIQSLPKLFSERAHLEEAERRRKCETCYPGSTCEMHPF